MENSFYPKKIGVNYQTNGLRMSSVNAILMSEFFEVEQSCDLVPVFELHGRDLRCE
jgi:hypothetical protein